MTNAGGNYVFHRDVLKKKKQFVFNISELFDVNVFFFWNC